MKAYILRNESKSKILIKSMGGVEDLTLKQGDEKLFDSEGDYFAYAESIRRLAHAKLVRLEVVTQKESKSVAAPSSPTPVKPAEVKEETKEVKESTESDSAEKQESKLDGLSMDDLREKHKMLSDKFKASKKKKEKEALKEEILQLKEDMKTLKDS